MRKRILKRRVGRFAGAVLACALIVAGLGANASARRSHAPLQGEGEGLKLVANIKYTGGSDMEFATIKGHDYAFTGSLDSQKGGLRVINIDNPENPKLVTHLGCAMSQADIQISHDQKTLIMAADSTGGPAACLMTGKIGFMTVDISNPKKPRPIGVAQIPRGSHNTTAHPTKPYVYNSDSDLGGRGEIQIWSIKNPAKPKLVNTVPSTPHSPHDISFNKKGNLAVTAAISHFDLFDTSNPEKPQLIFTGQCPGCSITHDAKFTPDGHHIVIGDEGGGGAPYPCPGGALYFYLLQSNVPTLVGAYEPAVFVSAQGGLGGCTSHVFDISDDSKKLSISWYTAGTRYLDISEPHGFTLGGNTAGTGPTELGWFIPKKADSWSSKMHKGPYIYSNDLVRGFDVYRIVKK
jgi:hypothetical protein